MRPADLDTLTGVSRPALDPHGDRVVVSATHPSLSADATVGQLFSVPLDGSGARRITRGFRDTAPAFSPDGRAIAFLRAGHGDPPQLHVMSAAGGEPIVITDAKLGVGEFRWPPDSNRIVYLARVPDAGRYGSVDKITPEAEPGRRITGVQYKSNGLGYTGDRPQQVFLIEVPALDDEPGYAEAPRPDGSAPTPVAVPASVQLTPGDVDYSAPRFDGDRVTALAARHPAHDRDLRNQLWAVGAGVEPTALTPLADLAVETVEYAPGGELHLLAQNVGSTGLDFVARNTALYRQVDGRLVRLTDDETVDLGEPGTTIGFDGSTVLVQNRTRGRRPLVAVAPDGTVTTLSPGDVEIEGHVASAGVIVVSYSSPTTTGDVGVLRDGVITALTDFSAATRATGIVEPVELVATARDGSEIHGWVAAPAEPGPHPTLLMIHGGPFAAYGVHLFDETQVYMDAGYAIVYCNPRGSAGYGQAHGRAIRRAMGTVDMTDVLDFLEAALARNPSLDRSRLGILGGSYGGYLTAWTIAHDHRFRAAVVERGYLDPSAFVGSSDIGWFFGQEYNGTDHELIRAQSPQAVANRVDTPTLVIHSEQDLRCPIGQAETYYVTLALNGVEAEMLVFPGEDHELSRSGRPRHREQRFDAILEWFGRKL